MVAVGEVEPTVGVMVGGARVGVLVPEGDVPIDVGVFVGVTWLDLSRNIVAVPWVTTAVSTIMPPVRPTPAWAETLAMSPVVDAENNSPRDVRALAILISHPPLLLVYVAIHSELPDVPFPSASDNCTYIRAFGAGDCA
jgi:hypothetical protein